MLNRPQTFLGRLKESCEDFLFELEDEFAGLFPTTKDAIVEDLRRTRDAAKATYVTAKQKIRGEFQGMSRDLRDEAAEELQDLVEQYKSFRESMRNGGGVTAQNAAAATAAAYASGELNDDDDEDNEQQHQHHRRQQITESEYRDLIRQYENDLRSPDFMSGLNKMVRESMPSSDELLAYYLSRPELADYTIQKELHRMAYTVHTHDGKQLTTPQDIEQYYQQQQQSQQQDDGEENICHEILWRAANQSLLGDIIVALTSDTGLIRPQLEAATFVNDLSMILDFSGINHNDNKENGGADGGIALPPHAKTECFLNLSIPGYEGERLSLAGVLVIVFFCPEHQEFKARITAVFPSPNLSEEQVSGAACSLFH